MSCPAPPKLLTYYTNKVNIYDNPNFIKLPNYITCPPPPLYYYPPYPYPSPYPYEQQYNYPPPPYSHSYYPQV
jgi:hypothetical protein